VNCCKTFILIFTDGEPTQDQNIPSGLRDNAYNGVDCTNSDGAAPPRPIDGTCNTHSSTPFTDLLAERKTDYASNGSGYLDSVALWAHTNDLRPCSGTSDGTIAVIGETGHCLSGMQNVTVYTFFAFGNINGRGLLAQTARLGAFDDANANGIPDVGEWDKENNYTGTTGADGIPDAYFESSDVDDIQNKMLATLSSIIRKSSSGAAVSVLATSSTGEGALYQAYFYPSTQVGTRDVTWTGYTQSLWVDTFGNMREDTNGDAKLDYLVDLIVKTRLDPATGIVYVDKYIDADGNGIADDRNSDGVISQADCYECGRLLSEMKPIWEAGKQLALKDASTRTILTWVDVNNDKIVDASEQIDFTTANSATLGPYLRAETAVGAVYTADAIINFIRGCEEATCSDQKNLRDRRLTVDSSGLKIWKLGDVINAPPTIVAAPRDRYDIIEGDPSYTAFFVKYRTRRQVAYVGANDGMLHAFNAGYYRPGDDPSTTNVIEHGRFTRTSNDNSGGPLLGEELWGFIPYELLPHLQWLTRSDYQHVYYVDMPPVVKDVRIFDNDTDHPNGWGTVLIGGFRLGGSCGACTPGGGGPPMGVTVSGTDRYFYSAYFVLDITNPEVHPKLLWSFSDSSLGLTSSVPTVVRVSPLTDFHADNTNAKWYLLAGSGPTGYDGRATQSAKVFAIDLKTGPGSSNSLVSSFSVGSWNSFIGDMTAFDRNLDYRTDVVYFGRTITDDTPSTGPTWRGKVYRLTMGAALPFGGATGPGSWGISGGSGTRVPTEMLDTIGVSSPVEMGPVMAAPGITVDDSAQVWVFVGSGRYFGGADKTDKSTQYFVGMKDSVVNGGCTQTSTGCRENDLVDVTAATICLVEYGNCGQLSGTNQLTGVTGATTMAELMSLVGTKDGWVAKLLPRDSSGALLPGVGERVLSAATVFGGIVFFPTFTPTDDICASTGSSSLYALFYKTGGPHTSPIVGSTAGTGGIVNVNRSTSLGDGLAFGAVPHVGSGADGTSPFRLFINTSTGALDGRDVNLAIDPRAHFASWINM
jgi:type IV pilus assembly protein PilY1